MLADDTAVEDVALRPRGLIESMPAGSVHVSMSTISPSLSRRLAKAHASQGQRYVSATVLGRPEAAEQGKLYVLASGEPGAIAQVRPLLEAMGQRIFDVGDDAGAANLVKVSCNFLIASAIESLSEAFALVRKAGCIDPQKYLEILINSLFACGVYEVYGKHVLEHDFRPGFRVPLALKDIELGIAAGKDVAVPMPLAGLIRDHLVEAVAHGWKDLDWSSLALVSLDAAGLPLGSDGNSRGVGERRA
jgi:3-hydroxyisobutyrate dehydrogenase-like beta-hydroxyacid dehydrogenase